MRIAVIPGDGIGVDTTAEAVKAIRAVGDVFGRQFDLEMLPWGADYFLQSGITIPPDGYAMLRDQFDAVFIGALGDPQYPTTDTRETSCSARASSSISTSTTAR